MAPSPEPAEAETTKPKDGENPTEETKEGDAKDEKKPMEEEKADVKEEEVEKKADAWPTSNWWEKDENVKEEEKAAQSRTPEPAVEQTSILEADGATVEEPAKDADAAKEAELAALEDEYLKAEAQFRIILGIDTEGGEEEDG